MNRPAKNNRPGSAAVRKIVSGTGASITFALLLFLVCAVIGSVVLVAGTAAAGRISEIAEYDQRYYSVTSAAELLADSLNGQSVTVVREKNTDTTVRSSYEKYVDPNDNIEKVRPTGSPSSTTGAPAGGVPEYTNHFNAASGVDSKNIANGISILHNIAIDMVYGVNAIPEGSTTIPSSVVASAWTASVPLVPDSLSGDVLSNYNYTVALTDSGSSLTDSEKALMAVSISETLKSDGKLIFNISSPGDSNNYVIQVSFVPTVYEDMTSITALVDHSVTESGNSYTETEVTRLTETRTTVITWTLDEISTVLN